MLKQELAHLTIFKNLDGDELERIAPLLNLCFFQPDEIIFEQGQRAVHLYILLEGEVVIGWSAALRRDIYTSAAISVSKSEAICMSSQQLKMLCEKHPKTGTLLLEHLADVIAQRLNSTHSQILSILTQGMALDGEKKEDNHA
jgi:CRP/FNR family cyclic AMP-dependent transcriptional regulator